MSQTFLAVLLLLAVAAAFLGVLRSARASWRRGYEGSIREYEKLLRR